MHLLITMVPFCGGSARTPVGRASEALFARDPSGGCTAERSARPAPCTRSACNRTARRSEEFQVMGTSLVFGAAAARTPPLRMARGRAGAAAVGQDEGMRVLGGRQRGRGEAGGPTGALDDPRALEDCYRDLGPMVLAYLRRLVPAQEAEDVLQQVFLELWRSRSRYDPTRPLEGWVFGIAHKRAVDHLRRRARTLAGTEMLEHAARPAETATFADALATADAVREALSGLPDEQRQALVLGYFADLTQSQIAQRLGVPLGTVKARSYRGLRSLAASLVPEDLT